ncbi:MAG: hypothetical protein CMH53_04175 [Myxococcales bacterium]|nr:hypothetical protein [Myxococcales bacterium]
MAIVNIGGQDFLLQAPTATSATGFNSAAGRGQLYPLALKSNLLASSLFPPVFIDYDDPLIRAQAIRNVTLLLLGPFRPRPRPKTGYVYPRRIS